MCASAVDTPANMLQPDSFCKPRVNFYKLNEEKPHELSLVYVSAGKVDRVPSRDLPCKLARDQTFRFNKRKKGNYTSTHPRVKRTVKKAFTILTSSATAAASAGDDDECRNFGTLIVNKLRNYLPRTRNNVQHEINHVTFAAADQGLLMFHILSPIRHQQPRFPLPPLLPLLLVQKTSLRVI